MVVTRGWGVGKWGKRWSKSANFQLEDKSWGLHIWILLIAALTPGYLLHLYKEKCMY